MLNDHVASKSIRVTLTDKIPAQTNQVAGVTVPSKRADTIEPSIAQEGGHVEIAFQASEAHSGDIILPELECPNVSAPLADNAAELTGVSGNYSSNKQIDEIMIYLTSQDIKFLRASIFEGVVATIGHTPLKYDGLPDPPSPRQNH